MQRKFRTVLLVIVGVLVVAQFVPVERSVPKVVVEQDFLTAVDAPEAIARLVKSACYDCHSYETTYPWYSRIAPLSFWIQGHINGGRQNLNFSTWTTYPTDKAAHKLEECFEEIDERHMPLSSYKWLHPDANLTDEQIGALSQWFQQLYRAAR